MPDNRARNYTLGAGTAAAQALVLNYCYEMPELSQKWNNVVVKALFDNWQVSGVTTILSGTYRASPTATPTCRRGR